MDLRTDDDRLMLDHGTELLLLTGPQVFQAARSDLMRKQRNAKLDAERKSLKREGLPYKHVPAQSNAFAFALNHVREARSIGELIGLALQDQVSGEATQIAETMRLYRSRDGLREAAHLASIASEPLPSEPVDVPLPLSFA